MGWAKRQAGGQAGQAQVLGPGGMGERPGLTEEKGSSIDASNKRPSAMGWVEGEAMGAHHSSAGNRI